MSTQFRYFPTTADMGMEVQGENSKELFRNAARGMFHLIASPQKFQSLQQFTVEIEGESWDELFFKWLNELLFYYDAYKIYLVDFKITKIKPFILTAVVSGEEVKEKTVEREIKAVTYHKLEVVQAGDNWRAKVIFDL